LELEGRNVLIVGLARTGVAAARFLALRKARLTCTDLKTPGDLEDALRVLEQTGCRLRLGAHHAEDFLGADLIVVSPGVPSTIPPLERARAAGVEVIGEVELAFRHISCPIVAVTGTNGKTTTVHLIDAMLEQGGVPHWVGGNIGRPLTEFLLEPAADGFAGKRPEVVVAELSSFQLEMIERFRPRVAVWTNLSADHLDRYPDLGAYAEAKARIFRNQTAQDFAVLPLADPWLERFRDGIRARPLRFGHGVEKGPDVSLREGVIVYRDPVSGAQERYETGRVRVPGRHNLENMMCALAASRLCGADPRGVQKAMDAFGGLEHRVEFVAEAGGVRFYNDSKATTVDSVVRALECFDEPVLLLAGGKDKGGSFAPLRESLERRVRRLFLYGAAAGRMERELGGSTAIERAEDLEEAVARAWGAARSGEVVLLSPACSSFDMFRDYEDRGRRFKALVRSLVRAGGPKE
jgi:UDP-N-acetylmuramoylalanine--D-glutamate ligase